MRTLLLCLCLLFLVSCKRDTPLEAIVAAAASPTGGRTSAAPMLVADWKAGKVTLDEAINLAFEQLDSVKSGKPPLGKTIVPTSIAATEFAGAVLDATRLLDGQLPTGPEAEMFWMRVGGLSFAAAEEARAAGRLNEALDLVFAGHKRWQSDTYWYMHHTRRAGFPPARGKRAARRGRGPSAAAGGPAGARGGGLQGPDRRELLARSPASSRPPARLSFRHADRHDDDYGESATRVMPAPVRPMQPRTPAPCRGFFISKLTRSCSSALFPTSTHAHHHPPRRQDQVL
jgi:hypothetical protein